MCKRISVLYWTTQTDPWGVNFMLKMPLFDPPEGVGRDWLGEGRDHGQQGRLRLVEKVQLKRRMKSSP